MLRNDGFPFTVFARRFIAEAIHRIANILENAESQGDSVNILNDSSDSAESSENRFKFWIATRLSASRNNEIRTLFLLFCRIVKRFYENPQKIPAILIFLIDCHDSAMQNLTMTTLARFPKIY